MKNNENKKFTPFKSVAFCLCALMFVSSFALFAVSLALSLVDITAGGHISFTASGVYAKVTGSVTGTKTTNTLGTLNFDASTENFTTPPSWSNMTFDFTSDNLITFTVNFQNLSTENPLYVSFTDGLTVTNVTTTRTLDGSTVTTFPVLEVPVITTKTAVMTFKVDDIYKSVSSDFTLNMQLSDKEPVPDVSSYSSTFAFSNYNTSNKTVAISAANTNISGDITIPSKVSKDGVVYTVTKIVSEAFMGCTSLSKVTIPSSVTLIGAKALLSNYDADDPGTSVNVVFIFEESCRWEYYIPDPDDELSSGTRQEISFDAMYEYGYADVNANDFFYTLTKIS